MQLFKIMVGFQDREGMASNLSHKAAEKAALGHLVDLHIGFILLGCSVSR